MFAVVQDRSTDAASIRARTHLDVLRYSLKRVIPLPEDDCFGDLVRALDSPG